MIFHSYVSLPEGKYKVVAEYPSLVNLEVERNSAQPRFVDARWWKPTEKTVGLDGGVQWKVTTFGDTNAELAATPDNPMDDVCFIKLMSPHVTRKLLDSTSF